MAESLVFDRPYARFEALQDFWFYCDKFHNICVFGQFYRLGTYFYIVRVKTGPKSSISVNFWGDWGDFSCVLLLWRCRCGWGSHSQTFISGCDFAFSIIGPRMAITKAMLLPLITSRLSPDFTSNFWRVCGGRTICPWSRSLIQQ